MRVRKAVQILDRRREYLIERTAQGEPEKVGFFIAETKALDLAIELLAGLSDYQHRKMAEGEHSRVDQRLVDGYYDELMPVDFPEMKGPMA